MKKIALSLVLFTTFGLMGLNAQNPVQENLMLMQGIGPAISGSVNYNQLPDAAKKFIEEHFKNSKITAIEKEFATGDYDVCLKGFEIDFTSNGEIKEIEAKNGVLPLKLVRNLLPAGAFQTLQNNVLHENVESIEIKKGTFEVELLKSKNVKIKEMKFDKNGKTLSVER